MKTLRQLFFVAMLISGSFLASVLVSLPVLSLPGCANTPVGKAYQATVFTVTTVNTAEDIYGDLYRAGKVPPDIQAEVHKAVDAYNAAMDVEKNAVTAYYSAQTDATKQSALSIAVATADASRADLVNLIASLLPSDQAATLLATK